jgi:hypothetical protein
VTVGKKNLPPPLDLLARQELELWLKENADKLPAVVKDALSHYNLLIEGLAGGQQCLKSALLQLRRALGIDASSEKRKNSGDPIGGTVKPGDPKPKDPVAQLLQSLQRYQGLEDWHKALAKELRQKIKGLKKKLMNEEQDQLTADELEQERADSARESAEHRARLALGDGPQVALESAREPFMVGGDVKLEKKTVPASVNPELLVGQEVVSRMTDERTRYGFSLTVSQVTIEVEKVVIKDEGSSTKIISASTRDIGPPKMDVTWEFLANMTIMVSQYAYVAQRFVPVYLHNFRSLANARLLSGDDTSNRVNEFSRFLKAAQADPTAAGDPPWLSYATREAAEATLKSEAFPSLGVRTAKDLGFEFDRKDGNGQKASMQTTVIWGRGEADAPRSAIVFYRSHIGGFGNLLSICLGMRQPEFKDLTVQSDLSTVNLVSADLAKRFAIELAGCVSHARRPFALYEHEDPELCGYMLHFFKGLYIYEKGLDLYGRNDANVRAVRGVDSRQMWEDIKDLAILITQKWSKSSKIGAAAHYILRHFAKLTAYLECPIINISNDFSERMLRMENLIEANALFRNSLEGRFALDINRSSLQTAIAAHAPLQDYIAFVLRASPEEVEANPQAFTALAYARNNPKILI